MGFVITFSDTFYLVSGLFMGFVATYLIFKK